VAGLPTDKATPPVLKIVSPRNWNQLKTAQKRKQTNYKQTNTHTNILITLKAFDRLTTTPHPALKPLLHIITVHLFVSLTLTLAILFFNWFDHYYYILNLYPWTENKLRVDCLRSSPQALICFFPYYLLYICFYQMRPVNTVLYTVY